MFPNGKGWVADTYLNELLVNEYFSSIIYSINGKKCVFT